jgi:arylsulfatase A-like enzyme
MKKKRSHLYIGLALAASLLPLQAAETPRPNIVHIMVDDLGWQDIASHKIDGKPVYETPHLDRLTRDGRRFTEAYAPSPVCAPSRVSFLRGQYPVHTGVYSVTGGQLPRPHRKDVRLIAPFYFYGLPVEEPMIPEVLRRAGYVSGHVGKWHAGGRHRGFPFPVNQGFDFGFLEKDGGPLFYNDPELWNEKNAHKNSFNGSWQPIHRPQHRLSAFATHDPKDRFQLDDDDRPYDHPTELAIGFIGKNKDRPFFLNFCPLYVHGPFATRDKKRLELYCKKMSIPFPRDPGSLNTGKPGHTNPYYASMVDTVDWSIGKVVDYLEKTDDPRNPGHKLIENTYVFLDSDNGGYTGSQQEPITDNSPLQGGKLNNCEGGLRVPFIVRGPGVEPGSLCETPINLVDLYPTFMEIAGLKHDPALKLDGCNILPLIEGKSDVVLQPDGKEREAIFWFYPLESHMAATIRKGDWKLVNNLGVGYRGKYGPELFRVGNRVGKSDEASGGSVGDLGETKNLADEHPEIRDAMLAELNAFLKTSGASMPYRNPAHASVTDEQRVSIPAVLELGSKEDRVWVSLEAGEGKAPIVEAQLLFTMNPKPFDTTRGYREEWLPAPATISKDRVEAVMPPGATHASFCMRDANGFYVTCEPLPDFQEVGWDVVKNSAMLKDGYAYKPGLFALIKLGKQAQAASVKAGLNTSALKAALAKAQAQYVAETIVEKPMCDAIRALRAAIRNQQGIPQAAHPLLNRFPTEPLF